MPRTKPRSESPRPTALLTNGPAGEVLTLAEAAMYLRLPEADVLRLVNEQGLPARHLATEWRFLKSAIQTWLSAPPSGGRDQGIWAAAGALKDDPYLDDMLKEIERMRGRTANEDR
jgi:excisionase family DNA binding protein